VEYTSEITVDQPLEPTWKAFNDRHALDQWIPEIISIVALNEEPGIVGNRYQFTVVNGRSKMNMIETVTDFVPQEQVSLTKEGGQMLKKDVYTFTPLDNSTTIKGYHICRGKGYIHKCMFAFFKPMFKKIDQETLQRFKEWVGDRGSAG